MDSPEAKGEIMTEQTTKTHEAEVDEGVLSGVLREDKPATETPVPARRGRRAPAAKPATETKSKAKAPAQKAPASKPATKPASRKPAAKPEVKAESNGHAPSARDTNQALAVELVNLVAGHFSGRSKADQEKIANWLKVLPTGGRAHERYWPAKFARPTTADWRKPE